MPGTNYDYLWKIEKEDGTILLDQSKDDSLKEINNLPKPYYLILYPNPTKPEADQKQIHKILLDGDKRWIYFRRVYRRVDRLGDHLVRVLYCYGYQRTDNGRNIKVEKWFDPKTGNLLPEDFQP